MSEIGKFIFVMVLVSFSSLSWPAKVFDILPPITVSKSNVSTWATPIAYRDGMVFIVTVEKPDKVMNGINLMTVVRKGKQIDGMWNWESYIVDSETIDDQWHTVPSLAIDVEGYIHIAYNMHTMPWQYSVSSKPLEINGFKFMGESVTSLNKLALKHFKRTPFPGIGRAAIPGNQITYPAFFYDRKGDLFITYRFNIRPKLAFNKRGWAAGIAKYNYKTQTWGSIGGSFTITNSDARLNIGSKGIVKPFALTFGWVGYLPRLAFDSLNQMHVIWMWRQYAPGSDHTHPSYAWSPDGGETYKMSNGDNYKLPITVAAADLIKVFDDKKKYYGPTRILIGPNDMIYFLLQPIGQARVLVNFDKKKLHWSQPEKMPYSATDFAFDDKGNLWAFAGGLKIFKRPGSKGAWQLVHSDKQMRKKDKSSIWCQPKVLSVPEQRMFLLYSQTCDFEHVKVTEVKWD